MASWLTDLTTGFPATKGPTWSAYPMGLIPFVFNLKLQMYLEVLLLKTNNEFQISPLDNLIVCHCLLLPKKGNKVHLSYLIFYPSLMKFTVKCVLQD